VARDHGRHLVEHEHFPAEKVIVIPNGVDVTRFQARSHDRARTRSRLGLPDAAPVAILVAALRPEKNHARFLRVASLIRKRVPHARFVVVGEGHLRQQLESLAQELSLAEVTHFLGSRGDIPELLTASDVFLLTSDNEASPVSILEAMACGLPVVASDVGSIHETVIQGVTGYRVPKDLEEEFANRTAELLLDRPTALAMGIEGRQHVVERSSVAKMVDGYRELLERLYQSKAERPAAQVSASPRDGQLPVPRTIANLSNSR
ncbi:MAG TPA: glycosyltransferase, partial [Pirellulaceae bacterium]